MSDLETLVAPLQTGAWGQRPRRVFTQADLTLPRIASILSQACQPLCCNVMAGRHLTALFLEPSSRTVTSFVSAMGRMGGSAIVHTSRDMTSLAKGESMEDTLRTFCALSDVLVVRSPDPLVFQSIDRLPSTCAVINAGNGAGEHPTQALGDLLTILQHVCARPDVMAPYVLTVTGDLRYGRTVHSLLPLISRVFTALGIPLHIHLISPPEFRCSFAADKDGAVRVDEGRDLAEVLATTDALYMTRLQTERARVDAEGFPYLSVEAMRTCAKEDMIVMHPLPRVSSIERKVDEDPRAVYFTKQIQNGMLMRAALIRHMILGAER